jgi:ketohexokinase
MGTNDKEYEACYECDETITAVDSALNNLDKLADSLKSKNFLLGFDGYIDTIYRMVRNRISPTKVEYYDSMVDFGQRIVETAGSSGSIERILKKKLGGGFAPNMARAIANMAPDSKVELFAAMGVPEINPIFRELPSNVSLTSVGNMGLTLAMEFHDGKIMSQDMEGIITLDWEKLVANAGGRDAIITAFENADAIGNGHWSLMPHMTNYWENLITDILPNVSNPSKKLFMVDPADLQKRSTKEIREMLFTLKKMNETIPTCLSLNDREAIDVARVLSQEGVPMIEKNMADSYEKAGKNINEIINLDYFVIHDPHFATITGKNDQGKFHYWIAEGYTSKPKFTTAAGDHFNAAVMMCTISDFTPVESLVIANAATAIFVRTGQSPSLNALKDFVKNYFDYINDDIDFFEFPEDK